MALVNADRTRTAWTPANKDVIRWLRKEGRGEAHELLMKPGTVSPEE